MKCLCCNQSFDDQFSLKEYYLTCHNVDENNYFFGKLFTREILCIKKMFSLQLFLFEQKR